MVEFEFKGKKWKFSDRLEKRMEQLHIVHDTEVYKSIGINQRTFSKMKTGTYLPKTDDLFKLAVRLNCTTDYLLGLEEEPTHEATDIAKYTGLSGETIEQLHLLASQNKKKDDSFRYSLDFIQFMMRDDEFQIHSTFNPKEETIGTIIKEAVDSFNTYYRKKRKGMMESQKEQLDLARDRLRNYGIKALYLEELLEYYQQLLSKRMSKITDEWLESFLKNAAKLVEKEKDGKVEYELQDDENVMDEESEISRFSAMREETVFEDTYVIVPKELLKKMNSIGRKEEPPCQ